MRAGNPDRLNLRALASLTTRWPMDPHRALHLSGRLRRPYMASYSLDLGDKTIGVVAERLPGYCGKEGSPLWVCPRSLTAPKLIQSCVGPSGEPANVCRCALPQHVPLEILPSKHDKTSSHTSYEVDQRLRQLRKRHALLFEMSSTDLPSMSDFDTSGSAYALGPFDNKAWEDWVLGEKCQAPDVFLAHVRQRSTPSPTIPVNGLTRTLQSESNFYFGFLL